MRRYKSILLTVVLAVTTVGVAAVPTTHAVGGTITGVVLDTAGNPIVGATVFTQLRINEFNPPFSGKDGCDRPLQHLRARARGVEGRRVRDGIRGSQGQRNVVRRARSSVRTSRCPDIR